MASTATRASCCAPTSSARPTASSCSDTQGHGKVRAVAKGVRKTKSRVRRPARADQPRRAPALRGPRARHRHPGRVARPLRGPCATTSTASPGPSPLLEAVDQLAQERRARRPRSTRCSSAPCGRWPPRTARCRARLLPEAAGPRGLPARARRAARLRRSRADLVAFDLDEGGVLCRHVPAGQRRRPPTASTCCSASSAATCVARWPSRPSPPPTRSRRSPPGPSSTTSSAGSRRRAPEANGPHGTWASWTIRHAVRSSCTPDSVVSGRRGRRARRRRRHQAGARCRRRSMAPSDQDLDGTRRSLTAVEQPSSRVDGAHHQPADELVGSRSCAPAPTSASAARRRCARPVERSSSSTRGVVGASVVVRVHRRRGPVAGDVRQVDAAEEGWPRDPTSSGVVGVAIRTADVVARSAPTAVPSAPSWLPNPIPRLFDKVVNLCKRRGFVFPSAEIYGGFRSTYDYGPLGVLLLRNVKDAWWRSMVQLRDDVVGLDAAILVAARRLGGLGPPGQLHRPARRLPQLQGAVPPRQARRPRHLPELRRAGTASPRPASSTSCSRPTPGPVEDDGADRLPAPRDGAGHVRQLRERARRPAARSRRSASPRSASRFRNEITPGNFVFRTREFEQMEMEFFVPPAEAPQWYEYWCDERHALVRRPRHPRRTSCACGPTTPTSCRHYSSGTVRRRVPLPVGLGRARGHRQPRRLRPHASTPSTRARSSSTSTRPPTSATCPT